MISHRSIRVRLSVSEYRRYVEDVLGIFYLYRDINFMDHDEHYDGASDRLEIVQNGKDLSIMYALHNQKERIRHYSPILNRKENLLQFKKTLFLLIRDCFGIKPVWGFLTGVRPVNLAARVRKDHASDEEAICALERDYVMERKQAKKLIDLAHMDHIFFDEETLLKTVSIYISIPFCPSRCTYCSFMSHAHTTYEKWGSDYIEALLYEIHTLKRVLSQKNLGVYSIYIGGGTPAVLSEKHIDRLLAATDCLCDSNTKEVTFEAGRADVFTKRKQAVVKAHHVTRLCINVQSMCDETLEKAGRAHTVDQFLRCYASAVDHGFSHINTDVIVGWPSETPERFQSGFEALLAVNDRAVTVHTLALKKKAEWMDMEQRELSNVDLIHNMSRIFNDVELQTQKSGLYPYYLYRQKMTVANRENIGYAKKGYECLYNMLMMNERQTVFGLGAGAVSRLVHESGLITRQTNKKEVLDYITDQTTEFSKYYDKTGV